MESRSLKRAGIANDVIAAKQGDFRPSRTVYAAQCDGEPSHSHTLTSPQTTSAVSKLSQDQCIRSGCVLSEELKREIHVLHKHGYQLYSGKLGSGKYCTVRLAEDRKRRFYSKCSGFKVAVKVVDTSCVSKDFLEKFLPREVRIWPSLRHDNIVTMFEHFEEGDKWFLVLELVPNGDLLTYVQRNGAQNEAVSRQWFLQLTDAVRYLHSMGVAHRDLKLENILIGARGQMKLADFGFCRQFTSLCDLSSTYCGSKAYSAPEILRGKGYDPFKADVWSLGVILFILVNGRMPFNEHVPHPSYIVEAQKKRGYHYSQRVTTRCRELVDWMMSFNWSERPCIDDVISHVWSQTKPPAMAGDCLISVHQSYQ